MPAQLVLPFTDLPVRPVTRLTDFVRVAPSKSEFYRGGILEYDGWRTSTNRIYMLCPFHLEKTPSLVVCPKERRPIWKLAFWCGEMRRGVWYPHYRPGHRLPHYHCYGCGMSGTKTKLLRYFKEGGVYGSRVALMQWVLKRSADLDNQPLAELITERPADNPDDVPF